MIKSILKWTLGIIGAAAIGFGAVHAIKMNTDENYKTHINAAWGIEQTIEDEKPEDGSTPESITINFSKFGEFESIEQYTVSDGAAWGDFPIEVEGYTFSTTETGEIIFANSMKETYTLKILNQDGTNSTVLADDEVVSGAFYFGVWRD